MNLSKFIFPLFLIMCVVQWFVPARMIFEHEDVIDKGITFFFKTAPIDPNDPFRGKYIYLNYDFTEVITDSVHQWKQGEKVYVIIKKNPDGFAVPDKISKDEPVSQINYVRATIGYVFNDSSKRVNIHYPFDRFYMEEYAAPVAETVYVEASTDTTNTSYALVKIKKGQAVVEDVFINDTSIIQLVKNKLNKELIKN